MPYYLNFVMIKRDNSLWKFYCFVKIAWNQNVHVWQQILQNVEFEWILNNGLKRGFKSFTLVDNENLLTSKNLCVVNLLSLFVWCNLRTKVLKELESWNYALQVDIHVHQWFFAFPCQSSKKNNILSHKGTS